MVHQSKYHLALASYFQKKPLYLDEPTQKKPNVRKLVEQSWQLYKLNDTKLLFTFLQNPNVFTNISNLIDFSIYEQSVISNLTKQDRIDAIWLLFDMHITNNEDYLASSELLKFAEPFVLKDYSGNLEYVIKLYNSLSWSYRNMGDIDAVLYWLYKMKIFLESYIQLTEVINKPNKNYNKILASYFQSKIDPEATLRWEGNYPRAFIEVPYQKASASDYNGLYKILTDFSFLEKKAGLINYKVPIVSDFSAYRGIYEILRDSELFLMDNYKSGIKKKKQIQILMQFLRNNSHSITLVPDSIFQICYNSSNNIVSKCAKDWYLKQKNYTKPWVKRLNRPKFNQNHIQLRGHKHAIKDLSFTTDNKYLFSIAGGYEPLFVWDVRYNQIIKKIDLWPFLIDFLKGIYETVNRKINRTEILSNLKINTANVFSYSGGILKELGVVNNIIGIRIDRNFLCLISQNEWNPIFFAFDEIKLIATSANYFYLLTFSEILVVRTDGSIKENIILPSIDPSSFAITSDDRVIVIANQEGEIIVIENINESWQMISKAYLRVIDSKLKLIHECDFFKINNQRLQYIEYSVSINFEGNLIAISAFSQNWSGEICIFELQSFKEIKHFKNYFSKAKFSPLGTELVFQSKSNGLWDIVGFYNIKFNKFRYCPVNHSNSNNRFAFSYNEEQIAVASLEGDLSIIESNNKESFSNKIHPESQCHDYVNHCIISLDNQISVFWSIDKFVIGYNLINGDFLFSSEKLGWDASSYIRKVGINSKSDHIYVIQGEQQNSSLRIFEIKSKKLNIVYDNDPELRKILEENQLSYEHKNKEDRYEFGCAFSNNGEKAAIVRIGECLIIDLSTGIIL
jgi:WD40 repeat protein